MLMAAVLSAVAACAAASSAEKTITNGLVTASFSADCSLAAVGLKDGAQQQVRGDGWQLELSNRTHSSKALRPSLKVSQPSASELLCEWDGGISVRYSAPPRQMPRSSGASTAYPSWLITARRPWVSETRRER